MYLLLKFPYVPFDALPDPADDVVLWSWSWAELVVSVVSCRGRKSISVIPILLLWQGRRNLVKISLFQKFSSSQIQWRSGKKLWQFEFFVFLPEQNRSTVVSLDFFLRGCLVFLSSMSFKTNGWENSNVYNFLPDLHNILTLFF